MASNLYWCVLVFTIVSTLGSSKPNNERLSNSSSKAADPEDEWVPGPNPWVFDSASNPILEPPDLLEWILGDPAVIQLGDHIHMFANEVLDRLKHEITQNIVMTCFQRCSMASYISQLLLTHQPISPSMIR